jgi:hypothetical protein
MLFTALSSFTPRPTPPSGKANSRRPVVKSRPSAVTIGAADILALTRLSNPLFRFTRCWRKNTLLVLPIVPLAAIVNGLAELDALDALEALADTLYSGIIEISYRLRSTQFEGCWELALDTLHYISPSAALRPLERCN